jgi:amino acid adenylation domain-containing protein/non-ribosomal peptide synthase protein (TIGR01720 family)
VTSYADAATDREVPVLPAVQRLADCSAGTVPIGPAARCVLLGVDVALDLVVLHAAVDRLLARHSALTVVRTEFAPSIWSLEIAASPPAATAVVTSVAVAETVGPSSRELAAAAEEAARRLSLDEGLLLQIVVLRAPLGAEHTELLVVAHELACDDHSMAVLAEDLAGAYASIAAGVEPDDVSRPGVVECARRQRDLCGTPPSAEELASWRETFASGDGWPARAESHPVADPVERVLQAGWPAGATDRTATASVLAALAKTLGRDPEARPGPLVDVLIGRPGYLEPEWKRTVAPLTEPIPLRVPLGGSHAERAAAVTTALRADAPKRFELYRHFDARTAREFADRPRPRILVELHPALRPALPAGWSVADRGRDVVAHHGSEHLLVIEVFEPAPEVDTATVRLRHAEGDAALLDRLAGHLRDELAAAPIDHELVELTAAELDSLVAGSGQPVSAVLPLSPLQAGMYVHSAMGSERDVYYAQNILRFATGLDARRLGEAYDHVLARHPSARAGFWAGAASGPVRFVVERIHTEVAEIDLREHPDPESSLAEFLAQDRDTRFVLSDPPLSRLTVLKLPAGDVLVFTYHLLLWDGWSRELVLKQLFERYRGEPPADVHSGAPRHYRDYLSWIAGKDSAAALRQWRRYLEDLDTPTLLAASTLGRELVVAETLLAVLPASLSAELNACARRLGVTLNSVLNAALGMTLAYHAGQASATFGTAVSGRPTELDGVAETVGVFLNTVPVRVNLKPAEPVAELVARLHAERAALMEHDYVGLGDIQRELGGRELFDSLYVLQNFLRDDTFTEFSRVNRIEHMDYVDHTHFPLTWVVAPGQQINVRLEFRPDLISRPVAEELLDRFVAVLTRIVTDPSVPVGSVAMLTGAHRAELTSGWDGGPRDIGGSTVAELLSEQARAHPDRTALVFGTERVSFAELDRRICRLARALLSRGAAPERVVALGLPRSIDMVVALFAVLRTGAAYLPLEPDQPDDRLAHLLADAGASLLVTDSLAGERLRTAPVTQLRLDDPAVVAELSALSGEALSDGELGAFSAGNRNRLELPAYVIYTSGSTGRPKGVVTPYRGLTNMQVNHREKIFAPTVAKAGGRVLRIAHTVSFAFDMSWEELLWLVEGHQVHVCDERLRRDADALVGYCDAHRIDVLNVTPTYAHHLFAAGLLNRDSASRHRPVLVLLGGEAVPESIWSRLRDTDGTWGYNLYGPTEYTINTLGAGTDESATATVGTAITNTRGYVLDSWLRPVPDKVIGELYIAGVGLARGYLDQPGMTAAAFVADPFTPGGRMYRTGDMVRRRADGNLDFLGRRDDQVKIRGYRVELGEVESALAAVPGVGQAAVMSKEHPEVPGQRRLVGYIVPEPSADAGVLVTARDALTDRLPDYMVPTLWAAADQLPLTVNGKLDVAALPEPAPLAAREPRAPRTAAESTLCEIIATVLGLDAVGVDDDFFGLGGDSISSLAVANKARKAGLKIRPRHVFEGRCAAGLAALLAVASPAAAGPAAPPEVSLAEFAARPRPHRVPLSVGQLGVWMLTRVADESPTYNIPGVWRVRGPLDIEALRAAVWDVTARHEVLRTTYHEAGGGQPAVRQCVHAPGALPPSVNHATIPAEAVEARVARAVRHRFDLERQAPMRVEAFTTGAQEHVVVVLLHHIAVDEWSYRVLLADLAAAYAARRGGGAPAFEPLPAQNADFALWQAARLGSREDAGSMANRQLDQWRHALAGAPVETTLPLDRPRPSRPSGRGAQLRFELDAELTGRLLALAERHRVSMFMLMHAALAVLLDKHRPGSDTEDVVIGAPISERHDDALESVLGFFLNTLALRVDLGGNPTFAELLARAKDASLEAMRHQDVPFEWVIERLNPTRSASRNPLFQVELVYLRADPAGNDLALAGAETTRWWFGTGTAKFDATFQFVEDRSVPSAPWIRGFVEYATDLFDEATVWAAVRRLRGILEQVAEQPGRRLADLRVLTDEESAELVARRNALTPEPLPAHGGSQPRRTDAEAKTCQIFAAVLGIDEVGVHDDFFALGGHSLLALRLTNEIAEALSTKLSVHDVFDNPTPAGLAALGGADAAVARPPLRVRAHPAVRTTSPGQRQMWTLFQLNGPSAIYNVPSVLRLDGPLDVGALVAAWSDLVDRHEILRTVYRDGSSGLESVLLDVGVGASRVTHRVIDRTGLDAAISDAVGRPFDLSTECPIFATILELGETEHVMVVTLHHIAVDEWSWRPLLADLGIAYQARRDGREPVFPTVPVQYVDFAAWQREYLRDDSSPVGGHQQLEFWRGQLRGTPEECTFPPDRPRSGSATDAGGLVRVDVDSELTAAVHALAREHNITVFMLLHAALAITLSGHGNGPDVVIGAPTSLRTQAALGDAIGYFLNTLALRVEVRPERSVAEFLADIRGADLRAYDNLDVPFSDVAEVVRSERVPGRSPLFQVMLVCLTGDANFASPCLADVTSSVEYVGTGTAKFDASFNFHDIGEAITGVIEYATDLFDRSTVAAIADRFLAVLGRLVADPSARVGALDVVSEVERAGLVASCSGAERDVGGLSVAALLARRAQACPSRTALVFGSERVSFADLDARVSRLARLLLARGIGPERVVALGLPRSVDMVVALFAVLRTGGAYVPLELEHPDARLVEILVDSGAALMVTDSTAGARFGRLDVPQLRLEDPEVIDELSAMSDTALSDAELGLFGAWNADRLELPAYVIYTSGSTGRPKGVVTPYRGLTNMLINHLEEIFGPSVASAGGRVLRIAHTVSFAFDMSWEELLWLVAGHEVHICDEELRRDAPALVAYCDEHRVDVLNVTPTYAHHLFAAGLLSRDDVTQRDPHRPQSNPEKSAHQAPPASEARREAHRPVLVLLGGEAVPESIWRRLRETEDVWGYNLYGPTEYTINTLGAGTGESATATVGTAITNTRAYVLDAWLRPVPDGVAGELYIAGVGLARGYLGQPALTSAAFVASPFTPGGRMYRTGDMVRRRGDGNLDFLGRADRQVKIRGYRVELAEVETAVSGASGVAQAAVVARRRLAAYVIPERAPTSSEELLVVTRDAVAARLPGYMVPSLWAVVDKLPLTVNGKLDVAALPEPVPLAAPESRAPRNDVERTLSDAIGSVLGVDGVGIDDDFFALGGDSIMAIGVMSRVREAGLAVRVRDIIRFPTVAALAGRIQLDRAFDSADAPDLGEGRVEPTPVMRWLEELGGPITGYHQVSLLRAPAGFTSDGLRALLTMLSARHPMLRARLVTDENGRWDHLWVDPLERAYDCAQARRVPAEGLDGEPLREVIRSETVAARDELDAGAGGMIRMVWLDRGGDLDGRLLVLIHHLAVDGVSWRTLLDDIAAFGTGAAAAPPRPVAEPRGTSFRTWSRRLAEYANAAPVRVLADRWRRISAAAAPLPTLRPRAVSDVHGSTRRYTTRTAPGLGDTILVELPTALGVGVDAVLLGALGAALSALLTDDHERALVVDLEGHGRGEHLGDDLDLSRAVGWFTSIAPVLLEGCVGSAGYRRPDLAAATPHIRAIDRQLRADSDGGLSYGVLRYLAAGAEPVADSGAEVEFNYLGRFGAPRATAWSPAPELDAAQVGFAPDVRVGHALVVDAAGVDDGSGSVLDATFTWASGVLDDDMARLAARRWTETLESWARSLRRARSAGGMARDGE